VLRAQLWVAEAQCIKSQVGINNNLKLEEKEDRCRPKGRVKGRGEEKGRKGG